MHEIASLITDLTIILGVASIVTVLFQKLRQPVVLGYLVAGAIIGPYLFSVDIITDDENIKTISELGIIFLMFSLGLEFSFHKLKRVGFSASVTGVLEIIGILAVGFIAGQLLGWNFLQSVFLGAALSMSSTTIIIKAIEELRMKKQKFAQVVFGILIVEDLVAILLLVGLSTLVTTQQIISVDMAWALAKLLLVIGSWFLVGYFLIPSLFHHIKHYINDETLILVSVALCLFLVVIANYFHYSVALGAFMMGSILSETPMIHRIEQLVKPIRDIFAAVFFVSLGMLINPESIYLYWPAVLLICGITIVGKILATGTSTFLSGQRFVDALKIGFSMGQIGEFSLIIAALGMSLGVLNADFFAIIIAVSAITTFTTPYLIKFATKSGESILKALPSKVHRFLDNYTQGIQKLLSSPAQESLYRNAAIRLILNGILVAAIFISVENWVLPKIMQQLQPTWLEKGLAWLIATALASPFIWGMLSAFYKCTNKDKKSGASPLLHFSWALSALELAILSIAYFERWLLSAVFFIGACIMFRLFYRQLDKSYHWLEAHFTHNLQEHPAHESVDEVPWNGNIVEAALTLESTLLNKSINQQELGNQFGVNIIAIIHKQHVYWSHVYQTKITIDDKLVIVGEEEKINHFVNEHHLYLQPFNLSAPLPPREIAN